MITKREAAIISAYTGYLLSSMDDLRAYAAEKFGVPDGDMLSDYALAQCTPRLQERAKADFLALQVGDEPEQPSVDHWDVQSALYDALSAQDATISIHQNDGSWDFGDVEEVARHIAEALNRVEE